VGSWIRTSARRRGFNAIGARARERGIQFGFHSEPWDFPLLDGVVPFDYLLENTNPTLVKFQLDIGHMTKSGASPVSYLTKYPARFVSMHLKDVSAMGERVTLGQGIVPIGDILRASRSSGIGHYFVEDERRELGTDHVRAAFGFLRKLEY
jgi:sugar phosphate isomerase/epimerase